MNYIHLGIVGVSVSGWAWWPADAITWYIAGLAGIGAQWLLSGNHCILTDLEWWLKYNTPWRPGDSEGFVGAWARQLGVKWPPSADTTIPWLVLIGCIALGYKRMLVS